MATVSLLRLTNGDVDLVARILGWTSPRMIMERYGWVLNRHRESFAKLDQELEALFA